MPLGIYFKDYIFVVGIGLLRSLHTNLIFLVDLEQCLFTILLKLVRLRCIKRNENDPFSYHNIRILSCSHPLYYSVRFSESHYRYIILSVYIVLDTCTDMNHWWQHRLVSLLNNFTKSKLKRNTFIC